MSWMTLDQFREWADQQNSSSFLVYKPPQYNGSKPQKATVGVKFCQDTLLMKSFLDQHKIPYEISELEKTPMGLCLRIKKEPNTNLPPKSTKSIKISE